MTRPRYKTTHEFRIVCANLHVLTCSGTYPGTAALSASLVTISILLSIGLSFGRNYQICSHIMSWCSSHEGSLHVPLQDFTCACQYFWGEQWSFELWTISLSPTLCTSDITGYILYNVGIYLIMWVYKWNNVGIYLIMWECIIVCCTMWSPDDCWPSLHCYKNVGTLSKSSLLHL